MKQTKASAWAGGIFLLANLLVMVFVPCAAWIEEHSSDLYYRTVQEDGALEWASFWAFMLAAVAFWWATWHNRGRRPVPWFAAGVGLFCFVVAMEEISWGQRLLGFQPPEYFLANNFQQEFNFHNVVDSDLRQLAVKMITLGFGCALPVLAWFPAIRRRFTDWGIEAPPLALLPAFLATYWLYEAYPWGHSGEWVEMMLGLAFLFAALTRLSGPPLRNLLGSWLAVMILGAANAAWASYLVTASPEALETARVELEALREDFRSGEVYLDCGVHRRLYTFVERNEGEYLLEGKFSQLTAAGLPTERAEFLLDPWSSPYWIRGKCSKRKGRERFFVYSFGPNRRRESGRWEIRGDDLGEIIEESGF